MPKYANKCPQHNELDIYQGCSFNCVYCIAATREQPLNPDLELELSKITDNQTNVRPYYLSPWTDAYQHQESEKLLTQQMVRKLSAKNHPFFVITKSLLIQRDLEYFRNKENVFIAISLNTLDNEITKIFEPDAPLATERKELIENLINDKKLKTVVKIDPIIPGITDGDRLLELLVWLSKVKPYAVTAETLRLTKRLSEKISNSIGKVLIDNILSYYPKLNLQPVHPKIEYRLEVLKKVAEQLKRAGVKASFCKASLPIKINEFDCRGGYNYDY